MIGRYGVKGLLLAVTVIVGSIVALQTWLPPTATPASVPPSSTTPDSVKLDSVTPSSTTSDSVTSDSVKSDSVTPDSVTPDSSTPSDSSAEQAAAVDAPAAPELQNITAWVNSEPLSIAELRGKVVVVDFWTFGCYNCVNTLPYLREWHDKYADDGLVIVGVHSPEFNHEKDLANVQKAVKELGVVWPVAMDNDFSTWRAYENRYWPHLYLADAQGRIRYDHIGEGGYDTTEEWIQRLLKEAKEQGS